MTVITGKDAEIFLAKAEDVSKRFTIDFSDKIKICDRIIKKTEIMTKEEIYLVRKIDQDGTAHPHFTLNIDGVVKLLNMATPCKCKFEIEKIEKK